MDQFSMSLAFKFKKKTMIIWYLSFSNLLRFAESHEVLFMLLQVLDTFSFIING